MNAKRRLGVLAILAGCATLASHAIAQDPPTELIPKDALSMEVDGGRRNFYLGERLPILLRVKNGLDRTVVAMDVRLARMGELAAVCPSDDGVSDWRYLPGGLDERRLVPRARIGTRLDWVRERTGKRSEITLEPGEAFEHTGTINCRWWPPTDGKGRMLVHGARRTIVTLCSGDCEFARHKSIAERLELFFERLAKPREALVAIEHGGFYQRTNLTITVQRVVADNVEAVRTGSTLHIFWTSPDPGPSDRTFLYLASRDVTGTGARHEEALACYTRYITTGGPDTPEVLSGSTADGFERLSKDVDADSIKLHAEKAGERYRLTWTGADETSARKRLEKILEDTSGDD